MGLGTDVGSDGNSDGVECTELEERGGDGRAMFVGTKTMPAAVTDAEVDSREVLGECHVGLDDRPWTAGG